MERVSQLAAADFTHRALVADCDFDADGRDAVGPAGRHSLDAVITVDAASRISFVNPVAEPLIGWTRAEACGRPLTDVVTLLDEASRLDLVDTLTWRARKEGCQPLCDRALLVARDQREYPVAGSIVSMRDASQRYAGMTLVLRDLTAIHRLEQHAADHASSDPLTGLINRQEFEIRGEELIYDAERNGRPHAVLFLDVDQFAIVNDSYGRGAGDALLRQLAGLLQTALQPQDTLARLGNDEFGILLYGCNIDAAVAYAEMLLRTIQQSRFTWRTHVFNLSVSIGVAETPAGAGVHSSFLTGANSACAQAKKGGGNRACVYRRDDLDLVSQRNELKWAAGVAKALHENRMYLDIQPIAPSGETAHRDFCEVLLRMTDEQGNRVPPDTFIPAAERYHLMPQVDRWVIANALAALKRRHQAGDTSCRFAINVSGASLSDDRLADYVRAQLAAHDVPPAAVCFEITETAAVENLTRASAFIDELRELGCSFALDDFGRGQSSFAHLKNLAVDYLKIDGMFVTGMMDNEVDQAMVRAFNWIGHVRGLKTIAEHVESDAMLSKLREIGVDYVQGYGIARPAPTDEPAA